MVQPASGHASTAVNKLPPSRINLDIASTLQCSYEVSFEGTGAAIPLCLPNDCEWNKRDRVCKKNKGVVRNALILQEQALKILQSITGPVCVISIVGPCRTGKSYILSRLIGGERESEATLILGTRWIQRPWASGSGIPLLSTSCPMGPT